MVTIKRNVKCESCGVEVETIRTTTRFCSDRCRLRARKIRKNGRKGCKRCGEPIKGLQNVDYCSSECREMYSISKRSIRLVYINCARCGARKLSMYKKMYCAASCKEEARQEKYHEWYQNNRDQMLKKARENKTKYNNKCKECGRFFETTRNTATYCDKLCAKRYSNRRKEVARRKKILTNGEVDWSISIERLTKRDGKHCYICGDKMNYNADYNHDEYPNIEHVKPVSKGGTHTWDNVKLAHRKCNMEKSNIWIE